MVVQSSGLLDKSVGVMLVLSVLAIVLFAIQDLGGVNFSEILYGVDLVTIFGSAALLVFCGCLLLFFVTEVMFRKDVVVTYDQPWIRVWSGDWVIDKAVSWGQLQAIEGVFHKYNAFYARQCWRFVSAEHALVIPVDIKDGDEQKRLLDIMVFLPGFSWESYHEFNAVDKCVMLDESQVFELWRRK